MTQILFAWSVLLTVLTLLNFVLCLAIVRRLKSQAQGGSDQLPDLPSPGTPVGDFSLSTLDRQIFSTKMLEEPRLVAFLMPGCEPCASAVSELRQRETPEETLVVVVDDGPGGESRPYADGLRDLGTVALASEDSPVLKAFGGITGYPAIFRVADGRIIVSERRVEKLDRAREPVVA